MVVPAMRGALPALQSSAEDRLALLEHLIGSATVDASAQQALGWLAIHAGVERSFCAVVDHAAGQLLGLADCGASCQPWDLAVNLQSRQHSLIAALESPVEVFFDADAAQAWSPFGACSLFVVPLRGSGTRHVEADGLLLIGTDEPVLSPDVRWFAEVLGQHLSRMRPRPAAGDTRDARERMLLYASLDAVTDPILLTDTEGKLIIANSGAEKLFTCPEDASEGWRQAVALNNMLFSAALSSSAMEAETPSRRELLLVDSIEGSDLLFELLSSVVKDPREGTFVVSILRNVTDLGRATEEIEESQRKLRLAEAEVREERHRLDLIIDSVADPILVTDHAGDIVLMNLPSERLFMADRGHGEAAQRRVQANGAHFSSFVSNLLFSGTDRRWRGELSLVDPDSGNSMPVEAVAGKILSAQGELTWVVTILHDLTEALQNARLYEQLMLASKELEHKVQAATAELAHQNELLRRQALELEQASALKTQFLANMSHEFRTPLNAILGYTHMLVQGVSGPLTPAQINSLRRIESNGRNLLALINDILDISRIEAGRMPLQIAEFKVAPLVREVITELHPIIERSRLDVKTEFAARLPVLRTDRQKVKQIVLNLVSNAVKFTPEGSIRITCGPNRRARAVAVEVTDTGIGIAPEDHDKVFDDFRQLDSSTSRGHGGTGLGLSICRRLATMLGGRIALESAPGRGSTFTLHVPTRFKKPR
jgi:PAS domain S-box-containing protein